MAIRMKRSAVPAKVPTTAQIELGELAVNTYDGKLYMKKNDGTDAIVEITRAAATQAEAEAGTDNAKVMTALRVKQASTNLISPDGPKISGLQLMTAVDYGPLQVVASDLYQSTGHTVTTSSPNTNSGTVTVAYEYTIDSISGSLRQKANQSFNGSNYGGSYQLYLYKNDVLIQSWSLTASYPNSASALRTVDIPIEVGDVISWRHKNGYQASYYTSSTTFYPPTVSDALTTRGAVLLQSQL